MNQKLENGGKFNYLYGLINLAVVFCIVWLLWYVFMHADGLMKLYTPMYGFSLVAMFLASVVLLGKVLGWPGNGDGSLSGNAVIAKGILGTVIALAIMYVVYYLIFWLFIGGLGVAYFSPGALVAGGGTGAEPWNAREWASTAILYFSTAFLWWALVWNLGFGRFPWQNDGPWVVGFSRMFVVLFFAIITFAVMFHPHVCVLFPEAQTMVGAQAWWEVWAETGSAFWGLGLVLCTLFWVVFCDLFWEGQPFGLMDKEGEGTLLKGIVTFLVTLALGLLLMKILTLVFNGIWMEPYQGGQYTDGPDWRYIHMGEISGFCVLFAFIWKTYFNNFPNGLPLIPRAVIRSVIGMVGGLLIYWFYYSPLSNFFLGKVAGWAQPDDQPLVWTLLFLSVVLIQSDFFKTGRGVGLGETRDESLKGVKMADKSKRHFFRDLLREGGRTWAAFQEGREEAREKADQDAFFDSYESSYALTLAEEELVMDSARQAGIKTEGRDKNEIAKELFSKQGR